MSIDQLVGLREKFNRYPSIAIAYDLAPDDHDIVALTPQFHPEFEEIIQAYNVSQCVMVYFKGVMATNSGIDIYVWSHTPPFHML